MTRNRRAVLTILVGLVLAPALVGAQSRIDLEIAPMPDCTAGGPGDVFVIHSASPTTCDGSTGTDEAHCCCLNATWAACDSGGGGSGDSITVNSSAATDADFADGDIDWTLNTGTSPDTVTATVNCSGCIDATDLATDSVAAAEIAADAVGEPELKAVNSPTDEYALTYEATTGDFEWQSISVTAGGRLPSILNPPTSANGNDDEFEDGNITGWTAFSSGTTNPITSGTIDYTASLTTPIYDASSIMGSVAFQSDNSSVKVIGIKKSITLATDATISVGYTPSGRNPGANHAECRFYLSNASDSNETVAVFMEANFGRVVLEVNNNGSVGSVVYGLGADVGAGSLNFAIWKKTNTYYAAFALDDGHSWTYIGSVTKTGVTTLDQVELRFLTSNATPSAIASYDYFRYEGALDYSLVNQ